MFSLAILSCHFCTQLLTTGLHLYFDIDDTKAVRNYGLSKISFTVHTKNDKRKQRSAFKAFNSELERILLSSKASTPDNKLTNETNIMAPFAKALLVCVLGEDKLDILPKRAVDRYLEEWT